MDTTYIYTNLDFLGKSKLVNPVISSSASLPSSFSNIYGGLYYNTVYGLLSISHGDNTNRYLPYISDVPTSTKLITINNTGKIDAIFNSSNNKFVYLDINGTPSLTRYINLDALNPDIFTDTIINSDSVIPTSEAVYNAINNIGNIINNYLPLSGGTLIGALYIGNSNGVPLKFLNSSGLSNSIWSDNGDTLNIGFSKFLNFSLRNALTDASEGGISVVGSYESNIIAIECTVPDTYTSKLLNFTEIGLRGDNIIKFDTLTNIIPYIKGTNVDDESQISIKADHVVMGNSDKYFHISGSTLTSNDGGSIGLLGAKIKNIHTQNIFVDSLTLPSTNQLAIQQFNQEIRSTLNIYSPSTILSETAIFNAINNKLSLATTVKDGMIPMLPTDGELYYLNGDNLWIEKEWVVSTIDGKKYLSTGVGDFKSFNVSLIANGEISIGSEYLILETIPTTDPNIADSAYPTGLYIGRISTKPSSAGSSLYVAGSIRGAAFTCDNINYWKLLGVGTGTVTPNKILYVNINGVSYGIPATDNLT